MSFTSLDIDPATSPVTVLVSRPDGSPLPAPPNSPLSGCFGVDASGNAYFDPYPDPGQSALLGYDGSAGVFFLVGGELAEPHLMLLPRPGSVAGDPAWRAREKARRTFTRRPAPGDDRPLVETDAGRAQQARALAALRRGR